MSTYSEQLQHPKWQKKRLEILQRDNFSCCLCSDKETQLQIHHKRYVNGKDVWDYDSNDLQTLCKRCHTIAESLKGTGEAPLVCKNMGINADGIIMLCIAADRENMLSVNIYSVGNNQVKHIITIGEKRMLAIMDLFDLAEGKLNKV